MAAIFIDAVASAQKATMIKIWTGMPDIAMVNLPGANPGYAVGDKVTYTSNGKSLTGIIKIISVGQSTSQITPLNTYSVGIQVSSAAAITGMTSGTLSMAAPVAPITTTAAKASTTAVNAQPPVVSASTINKQVSGIMDSPPIHPPLKSEGMGNKKWLIYGVIALSAFLLWKYKKKIFKGK